MTDDDLEKLYKVAEGESHLAGLRAVYEAGALSTTPEEDTPDAPAPAAPPRG